MVMQRRARHSATVKTATAIRAWRRLIQLLAVIVAMYYAAGTYSAGFAITMIAALGGVWWMGKSAIIVSSREGWLKLK